MARRIKAMATAKRKAEVVQELLELAPRGSQLTCVQTWVNAAGLRSYMVLVPVKAEDGTLYIRNITTYVGELLGYSFTNNKDRLLSLFTTGFAQDMVGNIAECLYNDPQALRTEYYTDSFYKA